MGIETLRPDSTLTSAGGDWTASATTLHGDTSDSADGTYALSSTQYANMILRLGTYVLAAGERVKQFRVRGRARTDSGSGFELINLGSHVNESPTGSGVSTQQNATGTMQTITSAWKALDTYQSTQQDAIGVLVASAVLLGASPAAVRLAELYVELDVWARADAPTVTISEEAVGEVTSTDQPTIESFVAANYGTPGTWSWQVRVFTDAVASAGGFDPWADDADYVWQHLDTAKTSASSTSAAPDTVQVGVALDSPVTYWAYVRYGKNDVSGQTLWSLGGSNGWNQASTPGDPPAIAVTVEQANGRQTVEVTTAALTYDTVEAVRVERSDDGGETFATIRGGYITADPDDGTALAAATTYTFHDRDAPRATALVYRARTTEGITASDTTLTSAWATAAPEVHANDGQWWLYDVDHWDAVHAGARIATGPEIQIQSDQGVFYPMGRDGEAVVVGGTTHGDDGEYGLKGTGTDECAAVDAIARFTGTVLVKSPFGDQKYVVWLTGKSMVLTGTPAQPQHRWTLPYVEVGSGIGDDG